MKKSILTLAITVFVMASTAFISDEVKLVSKSGHISIYSHTSVEDITANNYKVVSTIDKSTGKVVFSVPMQAFEFEKSMMQKHFNSKNFLDTKTYPKAKLKGVITNLENVDFNMDGRYMAQIEGELELHGVTQPIKEKGTISVDGDVVTAEAKIQIVLADYKIAFEKGKPSTNIAKTIEVTIKAEHQTQD